MRIRTLEFLRAGQWTNLPPIVLGPRLTVILGDNEAGKSTAMRAVEAMLFGTSRALVAPLREASFRAAAQIESRDGVEVRIERGDGRLQMSPVDKPLGDLLAAGRHARFRDIFRLGHAEISADASLLADRNELGAVLFAATSGGGAAALGKAEHALAAAVSAQDSKAKGADGLTKRGEQYRALRAALEAQSRFAGRDDAELKFDLAETAVKQASSSLHDARESVRRIDSLRAGLEDHHKLSGNEKALDVLLSEGEPASESLLLAVGRQRDRLPDAERAQREATEETADASASLKAHPAVSPIATFAGEIDQCLLQSRATDAHREEREKSQMLRASAIGKLGELLGELGGQVGDVDPVVRAVALTVASPTRRALRHALDALNGAIDEHVRAESEFEAAQRKLLRAQEDMGRLPAPSGDKLDQARKLLAKAVESQTAVVTARAAAAAALADGRSLAVSLGLGHCTPEQLAVLPVPHAPTADTAFRSLEVAEQALVRRGSDNEEATKRVEQAAQAHVSAKADIGALAGRELLDGARADRQRVWEGLKSVWSPRLAADAADRLPGLAEVFEHSGRHADVVADQRFEASSELAHLDELAKAERERREELAPIGRALADAEHQLLRAHAQWRSLWPFLPTPPDGHGAWLVQHGQLVQHLRSADGHALAAQAQEAVLLSRDAALRDLLAVEVEPLRLFKSYDALEVELDIEFRARKQQRDEIGTATGRVGLADEEASDRRDTVDGKSRALQKAQSTWAEAALAIPEGIAHDPVAAESWLAAQDGLARMSGEIRVASQDIATRDEAIAGFEAGACDLIARVLASDPTIAIVEGLSASDAVRVLASAAGLARDAQSHRDKCQADLTRCELRQEAANTRQLERKAAIAVEWERTGLGGEWSDERIAYETERSRRLTELKAAVAGSRDVLRAKWTMGLDLALVEIAGRSDETLAADAQALRAQATELDQRHADAIATMTDRRRERDVLDLGGDAEALPQQVAQAASRVLESAEDLLRARLATWLLKQAQARALGRARPLFEAASANFKALTAGAYDSLVISHEGRAPELLAIDADGAEKTTKALSDGTRDQIWLSLRLAVVCEAARQTPLPLLLDDVFVHFDDARTSAALSLLAGLSEQVQVILFTHHDHVLDLARAVLSPEVLTEVVLSRPEADETRVRTLPLVRDRYARPAAPALTMDEETPSRTRAARGTEADVDVETLTSRIVDILRIAARPLLRNEVQLQLGEDLDVAVWKLVIEPLKERGTVEQVGAAKGTRYRWTGA